MRKLGIVWYAVRTHKAVSIYSLLSSLLTRMYVEIANMAGLWSKLMEKVGVHRLASWPGWKLYSTIIKPVNQLLVSL
jgi:hypothetical protein